MSLDIYDRYSFQKFLGFDCFGGVIPDDQVLRAAYWQNAEIAELGDGIVHNVGGVAMMKPYCRDWDLCPEDPLALVQNTEMLFKSVIVASEDPTAKDSQAKQTTNAKSWHPPEHP